jgi:hypothetical protein
VQNAEGYVEELERERGEDSQAELKLKHAAARWRAIPGDQQQLLWALRVFLVITLCILGVAVVSFRYIDQATTWPWTPRLLWVAGIMLAGGPIVVMWIAARLPRALIALPLLLALASPAPPLLLAAEPPQRTLIRSTPGGYKVYSYENAAGETVEETENWRGQLIGRRFYRPAPPACAYLRSLGLNTNRYWRDDGDSVFRCISPVKELGTVADPLGLGSKNGLSYHVDGDAERIHKMLLHLNVNQRHEAKQAHQARAQAAKRLTQAVLNTPLPKAAEQAIAAGTPWQGTAKAATLALVRDDWPTGKGYTLDFSVHPNQ